jgi:hypothetical protein
MLRCLTLRTTEIRVADLCNHIYSRASKRSRPSNSLQSHSISFVLVQTNGSLQMVSPSLMTSQPVR